MYFSGKLTVDPTQVTHIQKVRPQKAFRRLLHHLSAGLVSDREEQETFTAVAILQQLNLAFRQLNMTDIIRLAHDDIDFYHDVEGKKDDLKEALDQYDLTINDAMSQVFKQLFLVLDHEQEEFYYLVEITINRTHAVGTYPIEIKVNGLLNAFRSKADTSPAAVKRRMKSVFATQKAYDAFVRRHSVTFEAFLYDMQVAIQKVIQVNDVQVTYQRRMVAPQEKVSRRSPRPATTTSQGGYDPVFGDYYSNDDFFPYFLLWSDMAHDHHITIQDTDILTESGELLGTVGDEGVDAADLSVLSEDTTYDEGMQDVPEAVEIKHGDYIVESDSGSWFDGDWGGGDSDYTSSCSSCSSCASCGGD